MTASLSTEIDQKDRQTAVQIVERWAELYYVHKKELFNSRRKMDLLADLVICHANGNPIDFDGLFAAGDVAFMRDIIGIVEHLDHDTGKLLRFWQPLFSRRVGLLS